jgi:excisionase family DNA binding protein
LEITSAPAPGKLNARAHAREARNMAFNEHAQANRPSFPSQSRQVSSWRLARGVPVLDYAGMEEDRTQDAQQGEPQKEYVTVGEAAKLLGVHRNTVHHRIKAGRITAHKVVEGEREMYRVDLDSLGVGRTKADMHTLDAQRTAAGEELAQLIAARLEEIVHGYARELGDVREQLGAERARRYQAENELDQLRKELEEAQTRRIPWWLLGLLVALLIATAVFAFAVTNIVFLSSQGAVPMVPMVA